MDFPIFLFHRVNPVRDPLWDPMDPVLFEKCIAFITKRYNVVNLESVLDTNLEELKRTAAVVFDDGYKDNIDFAVPILNKYSCVASFYIVTDCIDKGITTWTHWFEYVFQNTLKEAIALTTNYLKNELLKPVWSNKEERLHYASVLKPILKTLKHEERESILTQIREQLNDVPEMPNDIMMSWDDVRVLHNDGFAIGSHSVTHNMLGTITDEEQISHELEQSAKRINEELGFMPETISYPIGSYNEKVIELSKKAGYTYGLAVKQKVFDTEHDDWFEIPRIELYNESWLKTRMRINGSLEKIKKCLGR